jgi:hypothetical protein
MRPANFPSIRLAQLAMLVHESVHLFSKIIDGESVKEIISLLNVTANDYWHYHYVFDEPSAFKKKALGRQMVENILINTVAPVLFAFGRYHQEDKFKEKAIQWMEALAAEKNNITRGFEALGIECKNAADSQALIRLKKEYCDRKRCLDCAVGNKLLRER